MQPPLCASPAFSDNSVSGSEVRYSDVRAAYLVFLAREPESVGLFDHYAGQERGTVFASIWISDEASDRFFEFVSRGFATIANLSYDQNKFLAEWQTELSEGGKGGSPEALYAFALQIAQPFLTEDRGDRAQGFIQTLHEDMARQFEPQGGLVPSRPLFLRHLLPLIGPTGTVAYSAVEVSVEALRRAQAPLLFSDLVFDLFGVICDLPAGQLMRLSALAEHVEKSEFKFAALESVAISLDAEKARSIGADPALDYLSTGQGSELEALDAINVSSTTRPPSQIELLELDRRLSAGGADRDFDAVVLRWRSEALVRKVSASLDCPAFVSDRQLGRSGRYYGGLAIPRGRYGLAADAIARLQKRPQFGQTGINNPLRLGDVTAQAILSANRQTVETRAQNAPLFEVGLTLISVLGEETSLLNECAASIELALNTIIRVGGQDVKLEWLITNTDSKRSTEDIKSALGDCRVNVSIRHFFDADLGPVVNPDSQQALDSALEESVRRDSNTWVAVLPPNSVLSEDAFLILQYYVSVLPCRLFSSATMQIDDAGRLIRFDGHPATPANWLIHTLETPGFCLFHSSLLSKDPQNAGTKTPLDIAVLLEAALNSSVAAIPEFLAGLRQTEVSERPARFDLRNSRAASAVLAALASLGDSDQPSLVRSSAARVRRVGVVIRTTGNRNRLLADALVSCELPSRDVEFVPILVVHGDEARRDHVLRGLSAIGTNLDAVHLALASDPLRMRGYGLNVGLAAAFGTLGCDAAGILDDDDIYLPPMADLAKRLRPGEIHVVGARALVREIDGTVRPFLTPQPTGFLAFQNFLPTNAFLATRELFDAVGAIHGGCAFPEDLHYLEDWMFLLRAFDIGARIDVWDDFVGEIRMGSDGNIAQREHPLEFARCYSIAEQFAAQVRDRGLQAMRRSVFSLPQSLARIADPDGCRRIISFLRTN